MKETLPVASLHMSCGLAPSFETVEHAKLAEKLGYRRVWLYDSPAIYLDIWASLGLVAASTRHIGLGTAVLVPSLRHVVVTASAIATIESAAPGRLACAFGTGMTARWTLGKTAMSLETVATYLRRLRGLLRGEVVEVDGRSVQMSHLPGIAASRPIDVPLLVGAVGPKGRALARAVADGVMTVGSGVSGFNWSAQLVTGTVLEPGEPVTSARVQEAVGPWYAIRAHRAWESEPESVDSMPGGAQWRKELEALRSEEERHIVVHAGHATAVTPLDRILVAAAGEGVVGTSWVTEPDGIRAKLDKAAAAGTTEVIYAPAGPDIARELRELAHAAGLAGP